MSTIIEPSCPTPNNTLKPQPHAASLASLILGVLTCVLWLLGCLPLFAMLGAECAAHPA